MQSACPEEGCGIADKHGIRNTYVVGPELIVITFHCPVHGAHSITLEEPDELVRLELKTTLRVLARALAGRPSRRASTCGSIAEPAMREAMQDDPMFAYAPLIVDRSGAKR
ncbi:hypothetical protein BV20DRAFT_1124044 [Pilatotrama ljubarskyi]|nr:hypothetical protein BV20DRAFT_1124044 [Pilatotrama ljubarskyi]